MEEYFIINFYENLLAGKIPQEDRRMCYSGIPYKTKHSTSIVPKNPTQKFLIITGWIGNWNIPDFVPPDSSF